MRMIQQLTIGKKIGIAFAAVLAVTMVITFSSYQLLHRVDSMFTRYREMARDSVLVYKLQGELLTTRMEVKSFAIDYDLSHERSFEKHKERLFDLLNTAKKEINHPARAEKVSHAYNDLNEYVETFQSVLDLTRSRNTKYMNIDGLIKKVISDFEDLESNILILESEKSKASLFIIEKYFSDSNTKYQSFLFKNTDKDYQKTLENLNEASDLIAKNMNNFAVELRDKIRRVKNNILDLRQNIELIQKTIIERNYLIQKRLDVIGPTVASDLKWVADDIKAVQDTIGPKLQGIIDQSLIEILLESLVAIIVGSFVSVQIVRSTVQSIRDASHALMSSAQSIFDNAKNLNITASKLSQSSSEQASSLEETSVSIEELTAMVKSNSSNASESIRTSEESKESAYTGEEKMQDMIKSMEMIDDSNDKIKTQSEESNSQIEQIIQVIKNIGDKTKVINDIVFQTKLLSFNASVEAARAGEHGKGFAVVAEEVGSLAQKSGHAANEISGLLESSIDNVKEIVETSQTKISRLIKDSQERVKEGSQTADECLKVLSDIVRRVGDVNNRVAEIASASKEQSTGIAQIHTAVSRIDQTTQQNSNMASMTAQYGSSLDHQAKSLLYVVDRLKSMVEPNDNSNILSMVAAPVAAPVAHDSPSDVAPMNGTPQTHKSFGSSNFRVDPAEAPSADHPDFKDN